MKNEADKHAIATAAVIGDRAAGKTRGRLNLNAISGWVDRIALNGKLGTAAGAVFFSLWIVQRFYFSYRPTLLFWVVTLQFTLFVAAYLTRRRVRRPASGFMETVYPFICAALPFALADYPFKPYQGPLFPWPHVHAGLMLAGSLLILAGIFSLRRSFSIMTEVREPVFRGVYRFCRHPMYLGSMVASLGVLFYNFSWLNLVIFGIFCLMQVIRSRREEQKIASVHPEYRDYLSRVGWVWIAGRSLPGRLQS